MNETTNGTTDTGAATDAANDAANAANGAAASAAETPKETPKESPKVEAPKETPKEALKIRRGIMLPKAETPKVEAPKEEAPRETQPHAGLRLRMKIWTDPKTSKRYLMPTAVIPDPRSGAMTAYAMSDEDTKIIKLTPAEWNALPFFYFQEDGPAPRASTRPVDVIR
jgi:hypothetical protein